VLLARRSETTGEVTHIVMQHRAVWSAEGGTWGIPGGATADGESPIEGALRESYEEANITPEDIDVVGSYCEDHGPWSYTTVFAFERPGHRVDPKANDDESMEIEWVPIDDVPNRKLLTAMRTDWPNFAARLRALAAVR
jgi:septum formation protein